MPVLKRSQELPVPIEKAWSFFSSPYNLGKITPEYMRFEIRNNPPQDRIFNGLKIEYTIRPVLGIPLVWETEILDVVPNAVFTDTQRKGPYKKWVHTHRFFPSEQGTRMEDEVHYELPLGILGKIAYYLFVRRQVESIFNYRETVLKQYFK